MKYAVEEKKIDINYFQNSVVPSIQFINRNISSTFEMNKMSETRDIFYDTIWQFLGK